MSPEAGVSVPEFSRLGAKVLPGYAARRAGTTLGRYTAKSQYRKLATNIPRNETARPHPQFLHLCTVSLSDLHIPTIGHECGNWKQGGAVSFLEIHKSGLSCSVSP